MIFCCCLLRILLIVIKEYSRVGTVVLHGVPNTGKSTIMGMLKEIFICDMMQEVLFSDTTIINAKSQLLYNAKLLKFVAELKKVVARPVKVKTAAKPAPRTGYTVAVAI